MTDRAIEWLRGFLGQPRGRNAELIESIIARLEAADKLADSCTITHDNVPVGHDSARLYVYKRRRAAHTEGGE